MDKEHILHLGRQNSFLKKTWQKSAIEAQAILSELKKIKRSNISEILDSLWSLRTALKMHEQFLMLTARLQGKTLTHEDVLKDPKYIELSIEIASLEIIAPSKVTKEDRKKLIDQLRLIEEDIRECKRIINVNNRRIAELLNPVEIMDCVNLRGDVYYMHVKTTNYSFKKQPVEKHYFYEYHQNEDLLGLIKTDKNRYLSPIPKGTIIHSRIKKVFNTYIDTYRKV